MPGRRLLLLASLQLQWPIAVGARAQTGLWPEWLGHYAGAIRFYGSIPLEDIYPPPAHPHVDLDDRTPIPVQLALKLADGDAIVWLRIDNGPMETATEGETLRFGPLSNGVAPLVSARAHPAPRTATLVVRPDALGTEALFNHADGSFWRRHVTIRFTPTGGDLIAWVFDAAGTRARTWRGSVLRLPN
jgi:hypothetical protein